jgi:uncharacterized membrane protein
MSEYLSWAKYVALVLFIALMLIVTDFEGPSDILEFGLILFLVITLYLFLEAYADISGGY